MRPIRLPLAAALASLAAMLSALPVLAQPAARPDPTVSPDRGPALEDVLRRATRGAFWGAVLVVDHDRTLLSKGYGDAGGHRGGILPDSLFDLGSVSKQFTAAALLLLAEDGKLALDDSISKSLGNVPDDKRYVTIRHLLHHTSGITTDLNPSKGDLVGRDAMVRAVLRAPMVSRPGEKFRYNNANFFLLAAIVDKTSGQSFEEFSKSRLFAPANMTATRFVSESPSTDPRETNRTSTALRARASTASQYSWSWWFKGATGVVSNLEDLRAWDAALRGPALLNVASRREMFTPGPGDYGTGWFIEHAGTLHARALHGGSTPGYRTFIIRLLDSPTFVAVLTNESHDPESIARALMHQVAPAPQEIGVWTRVYTSGFRPDQLGNIRSTHDPKPNRAASWMVMPEYNGIDEAGRTIRDERTTLVLIDPKAPGRWLMLSRIADEPAATLIDELDKAINLRKATRRGSDGASLEVLFSTSAPYKIDGPQIVDYPNQARWHAASGPAAAAKFQPERAGAGDERITLFLDDPTNNRIPIVARMDTPTAECLLADLKAVAGTPPAAPGPRE